MTTTTVELQPIAITVTRFVCPFCRRSRSRKGPALIHMARCWKNPEVKGCKSCFFFEKNTCNAGFRLDAGLVTDCSKWKPLI